MKDPTIILLSWEDGGPMIDFLSIESRDQRHSLFCANLTISPFAVYIELFGAVLLDTYKENVQ